MYIYVHICIHMRSYVIPLQMKYLKCVPYGHPTHIDKYTLRKFDIFLTFIFYPELISEYDEGFIDLYFRFWGSEMYFRKT
jgi:hypothetical protein